MGGMPAEAALGALVSSDRRPDPVDRCAHAFAPLVTSSIASRIIGCLLSPRLKRRALSSIFFRPLRGKLCMAGTGCLGNDSENNPPAAAEKEISNGTYRPGVIKGG